MADLPIPFSAPMVRALLREIEAPGTGKTQTRRTLNVKAARHTLNPRLEAPRYRVGDRLYVREHWRIPARYDDTAPRDVTPRSTTIFYECGGSASTEIPAGIMQHGVKFGPETGERWIVSNTPTAGDLPPYAGRFRQGMHMPRWASRITLLVTEVRVERLQDCSEADAIAEGVCADTLITDAHNHWVDLGNGDLITGWNAREVYALLWNHINGPGAWAINPWVAAYTFRPVLGNIDRIGEGA